MPTSNESFAIFTKYICRIYYFKNLRKMTETELSTVSNYALLGHCWVSQNIIS